jgi:hypothetical protein
VAPRAPAVDANDQQIVRRVHGLQFLPEHRGMARIGVDQATPQVEQRDVVVARVDQDRRTQPFHEGPRRTEPRRSRPMRDVARQHHHVGPLLRCQGNQSLDHLRLLGAEVAVGDLQ